LGRLLKNFRAIFLIAFLNSPYCETPKNAIKKNQNRAKQKQPRTEGGKNKKNKGRRTEENKATFLVMALDGLFGEKKHLLCLKKKGLAAKRPKNAIKKRDKKKKQKKKTGAAGCGLRGCGCGSNLRHTPLPSPFFSRPPLL
jgi:hypothetical protein